MPTIELTEDELAHVIQNMAQPMPCLTDKLKAALASAAPPPTPAPKLKTFEASYTAHYNTGFDLYVDAVDEKQAEKLLAGLIKNATKSQDPWLVLSNGVEGIEPDEINLSSFGEAEGPGWILIDVDGSGWQEIERDDRTSRFDCDEAALEYARGRAAAGDPDAIAAVEVHDRDAAELAEIRAAR